MAVSIDSPVGMRWKKVNVTNKSSDQQKIIKLLSEIPESQGGKKEPWSPPKAVPPLAGPDGTCPQLLVDAIWDFQVFWKNAKVFRNIDAVVDPNMNTIKQMNKLAGGGGGGSETKTKEQDVILRFTGATGGEGREKEREEAFGPLFNTAAYLETHKSVKAICFKGFREQEKFVDEAVDEIVRVRGETSKGVTIVIGSSAGGVSALKAASLLTSKEIHLAYVGINDAAFFSYIRGEVTFKPSPAVSMKAVIGDRQIVADLMENFFQTLGHTWEYNKSSSTGFANNAEFHLPLDGFRSKDLRDNPKVQGVAALYYGAVQSYSPQEVPANDRAGYAALVHRTAGDETEPTILARIKGLIKP